MKKHTFLILFLLFSVYSYSQIYKFECTTEDDNNGELLYAPSATTATYNTVNGYLIPTTGTIRALTIFINIIYDQTPSADPSPNGNSIWPVPTVNCINSNIYRPNYMLDVFDVNVSSTHTYNGMVTRLYAESSLNNLIILSDYMAVNIKQSLIPTTGITSSEKEENLTNAVITYINNNGGLNTYYGHNNVVDYDIFTSSSAGQAKIMQPDGKIDLICFIVRNAIYEYGGLNIGSGNANSYSKPTVPLMIGTQSYLYNYKTYQCVGSNNFTRYKKGVITHEIAHLLLGSNENHTSNGESSNGGTFLGPQYGFGLFGGGLLTCNAYERWRLGWKSEITANNVNSDITTQFASEQTFTLRDFVTYGDAIRIKLPYKDKTTSLNQYIWLENHQVGKNNKQDGYMYNEVSACRNVNQAGIYAYYQIRKNILESTNQNIVYTTGESANLKTISAEGNYNVKYNSIEEDCLGWEGSTGRPKFTYNYQNVFQGTNNQTAALSYNTSNSALVYNNLKEIGSKIKDGVFYNNLPWLGSNFDAFVPKPEIKMDISTNPSAVNTLTYYLYINNRNISQNSIAGDRATRKIYLTGLSIKMTDTNPSSSAMKAYTVKIRWNDYDVKQNVNWAGDIVLKEQLNLLENKIITLEQNLTPIQIEKDPVS
ncbi:MAG: hypothetical protein LBC68_04060, partial [Prevotellaceae bacterium]|nr:hypothetical protein [Prevotellaceae bacterium]